MINQQLQEVEMPLICSLVSESDRLDFLPKFLGKHFASFEGLVFGLMAEYSEEYSGGYWLFWTLSNGAFYMALDDKDKKYQISCAGNYFDGLMTADAAGVVVCLIALNRLACHTGEERFVELFYGLRDWALEHPEAELILAAID